MGQKDNVVILPGMDQPGVDDSRNNPIDEASIIGASQVVFDRMVTRNYLHSLSNCDVFSMDEVPGESPMRWYRIDKIVIEKNVFFADKLSMLYMSLHKTAKDLVLVLNKQGGDDIELFMGARDFSGNSNVSGEILDAGLQGFFPGVGVKMVNKLPQQKFKEPSISSVSAIASLRDDKKEFFVQGLERLINATTSIPCYRAYFIAESIGEAETRKMIDAFCNLYTRLAPANSLQLTYNESENLGYTQSFNKNFSVSIGESIANTVSHSSGTSQTETTQRGVATSDSKNNTRNILTSLWHKVVGGEVGNSQGNSVSYSNSSALSANFSDSFSLQKGTNKTNTEGGGESEGSNYGQTKGSSKQIVYKNRTVQFYLDILDKQLDRLQNGSPFGLWSVATYFEANDPTSAQQLANIYRGSIIGEESGLETCAINLWAEPEVVKDISRYLAASKHPRFDYCSLDVSAGSVVTSKELAIHLSFPQSSVPGIVVEERATFARNVFTEENSNDSIEIGNVLHLGDESETPVSISLDELTKHTFVTGSTGLGKSNALYVILSQIREKGKHFMVIEPAKGEYKHVFGCLEDVTVYSNTNRVGKLLEINPFSFPYKHVDVLEHIDGLVEIFNACWPMYAAMPAVLKHSVISAYEKCGWDIDSSVHKLDDPIFPTIRDVVVCLADFIDHSDYSADTKGDYKGALEVRLQELCDGMFGKMLNCDPVPDEDLFNTNVIVDLSRIRSTETKALLMGFIILKLNEFRMSEGGMNEPLKHITVLEEAHHLLKKTSSEQNQESSNLAGKSVEMISNSIAEMRTYGEAFILVDQSPSMLDSSAIRNTNTKIVLALPDIEDRMVAGGSMSLKDEQIEEIGRLKRGEAIVYQNIWEEPVQCKVKLFEPYEPLYRYDKQSSPKPPKNNSRSLDVVRFLLYPYIKEEFSIERIREHLLDSNLSTSISYSIYGMLKEYEDHGALRLWEKYNLAKLSRVVRSYMDMDSDYRFMTDQHNNMRQVRVLLDELLKEKLAGDLSINLLYYTELCYVRNSAYYEQWRNTFRIR